MNLKEEINKKAISWLIKEEEGLSIYGREQLNTWLKSNIQHKIIYNENKAFRQACKNLSSQNILQLNKEIQKESKYRQLFRKNFPIAASIVLFVIVSFLFLEIQDYSKAVYSNIYIAENKKINNIILPDNSIIDLDVQSHININFYKNRREANFSEGKAIFTIQKNKKRPFLITSGKTKIEVVGTKFEVINLDSITTVSVIEGIVRVAHIFNKNKDPKIISLLKKGDFIKIDNNGKVLKIGKTIIKDIASWKNDLLIFNKTPLNQAMKSFKRYNQNSTTYENSYLSHLEITGSFNIKEFNKFIHALHIIYPITIIQKGKDIQILEKN